MQYNKTHSSGLKYVSKVFILISWCVLCHFGLYISHVQCLLFNCL